MSENIITKTKVQDQVFLKDVLNGLDAYPKKLSSKYFYNDKGDELFQSIMDLDEYYLTRAEYSIFEMYKNEILEMFSPDGAPFNLVEFGAGDGLKTKILLKHFLEKGADFTYIPIDISQHALDGLEQDLTNEFPDLKFHGIQGDYFETLDQLPHDENRKNIIMFLGANIGNFTKQEANLFLNKIRKDINSRDMVFMGIDLKKDPNQILNAYNDSTGVTKEFNLNLLDRINTELSANFDKTKFTHAPSYDPVTGICKSCLLSLEDQKVMIHEVAIKFKKWEPIQTEISKKYSVREIHDLAKSTGFDIVADLHDAKDYFVDSIWEAI
ncbi:MAG: L-histidine N(alpha)-methyltransferase [Reichenbachiella sp.]